MDTTDMDVEDHSSMLTTNSISSKRFGLKSSIQTNFGDDYVFQIVPKSDWTSMAVSLSTNAVKFYSPVTGQYHGECKGHSATINQISYFGPSMPHLLYSCSADNTIRGWDVRTFQEVSCIRAGSSREIFTFSFGGSTDNLLAAGCSSQILFWDWRNKKQVACLEDSHVDDVTQVHFIPGQSNKLVSASEDGLICIFDTNGDLNDDDNLESVINVGTSIGKVGFLGETCEKLWCLTHIETLSIWDWRDARNLANFQEARQLASEKWTMNDVDYFVDCHYSVEDDRLWAIGGTNGGTLGYFPVNYRSKQALDSPEVVLEGGHNGVIRSVLPMSTLLGGLTQTQGVFGWSGGEDGRLCCWSSDNSQPGNGSWISSSLAIKSTNSRRKNRHSPY